MSGPKITLLDIELAPIDAHTWGLFDQTVGLNQIKGEWSILSYCAMPLHGKRADIVYADTFDKADKRDDFDLCRGLWDIMHDSDVIVAQNGKRFDMRKIRARMIMHGFPPPSPVRVEDTLLMARSVAAFTSNKLEWLTKYLSRTQKRKHKRFPGHELWGEFLDGNPAARKEMRTYNIGDVTSMRDVYLRLRPWAPGRVNVAAYNDDETVSCPICGSKNIQQDGFSYTNVSQYPRYHCGDCLGWSRGRYTINTKAKRKALLSS